MYKPVIAREIIVMCIECIRIVLPMLPDGKHDPDALFTVARLITFFHSQA
jgi:hypothetical protein